MVFNNSVSSQPRYNLGGSVISSVSRSPQPAPAPKNMSLNAPMIDRVYKAKPGCSACGKKVA